MKRRLHVLIPVVWAALCLSWWQEPLSWWKRWMELWALVPWATLVTPGLAGALARHAFALVLAAAAVLSFAGTGGPAVALVRPRGAVPFERASLSVILGFGILGFAIFAASLCGLAFPALLCLLAAAGAFLPGARLLAYGTVRGRVPRPGAGTWAVVLAMVPLVPVMLAMLMPDGHVDVLTYHLAIPDQVLRARKFTAEGACVATGFPLAAEFVYSLAICAGREELAHWFQAAPFVASVVLLAAWVSRRAGAGAGWAAAVAVMTCGAAGQLLTVAKNDIALAAFPVAGAVAVARALEAGGGAERGSWLALSGILFGAGCGVKFNGGILAAVAVPCLLAASRLRRNVPAWVALAALPAMPWLVRSWLWFGDPLWPALSSWWPGAWWRPEDAKSILISRGHEGLASSLRALAGEVGSFLWRDMPPVALALPFLLTGRSGLGPSGGWLAGFVALSTAACAIAMRSEWSRLAAPALFLLAALVVVSAATACRILVEARSGPRAWAWRGLLAAAAVSCWLPLGYFFGAWVPPLPTIPYLTGVLSHAECRAQRLTVLDEALRKAAGIPDLGKRMLVFGDIRIFGAPARIFSVRNYGATWAWEMAKAAPSRRRIRIMFRQLGVRWVMHNFITEGYPHPIVEPYAWDDRMIAVWRSFVERDLEFAIPAERVDNFNGGFCFWRLRDRPASSAPPWLPYLPGLDTVYNSFVSKRNAREWLEIALEVNRRIPNVDFITDRIVQSYFVLQDWANVIRYVTPSITHGTIDDANYWHAAVAYAVYGRWDESERMTARAIEVKADIRKAAAELREKVRKFREAPQPGATGLFPAK